MCAGERSEERAALLASDGASEKGYLYCAAFRAADDFEHWIDDELRGFY